MEVSEIIKRMIDFSKGNLHDIIHFMKVYAFARLIGECELLDNNTQKILEVSAILHDIACPLCREKYGNTNGKYQEAEGGPLAKKFLKDTGLLEDFIERVAYLISHHHTFENVDGLDYQILLEADYLVNADESKYSKENIERFMKKVFKTKTGIRLLKSMYLSPVVNN